MMGVTATPASPDGDDWAHDDVIGEENVAIVCRCGEGAILRNVRNLPVLSIMAYCPSCGVTVRGFCA
jgi:hypothetical protein